MLDEEQLKELLSNSELTDKDKLMLCLACPDLAPKAVAGVVDIAYKCGFRKAKKINVSDHFRKSGGMAALVNNGWELRGAGIEHVRSLAGPLINSPIAKVAPALRAHLSRITNPDTAAFVEQAIVCLEARQYRAAVVFSWVGAVALLHDHVIRNCLAAFNTDAVRRFAKARRPWIPAKNSDELSEMKEADFLVVFESIGEIDKNLKRELGKALDLRNSCGHPNSYVVLEHKASSHIEDLIANVFARF